MRPEVTLSTPEILNSTMPILYETGYSDWPYGLSGSCYPVRWKSTLYIISAFHCFKNFQIKPESLLYPFPRTRTSFLGFTEVLRAKLNQSNDDKHYDQVMLKVSEHELLEEIHEVNALDLSVESSVIDPISEDVKEVWLRGYPLENPGHGIDFELEKIRTQAFVTNGLIATRRSLYEHCYYLKVKTPFPSGMGPNGMSGSAVYIRDKGNNVRLAGTIIEYNDLTNEYLAIDAKILQGALRSADA